MASDSLYSLAFRCKKIKLWSKLSEDELFAVQLSNGEIAYCCALGSSGVHYAIAAYIGQRGLGSLRTMADADESDPTAFLVNTCLQCSFENKDFIRPDELASLRAYAKANGITFRGARAYPSLYALEPYHTPRPLAAEEEPLLMQALEAALFLSKQLESASKAQLGFVKGTDEGLVIPFLCPSEDGFTVSTLTLPAVTPVSYPAPVLQNELTAAAIRRLGCTNKLACKLLPLPVACQESPDTCHRFPFLLITLDQKADRFLPVDPFFCYPEDAERALLLFAETLKEYNQHPTAILVEQGDERTRAFLADFCVKCKIKLQLRSSLPELQAAVDDFLCRLSVADDDADDLDDEDDLENDLGPDFWDVFDDEDDLGLTPQEISMYTRLIRALSPQELWALPEDVRDTLWDLAVNTDHLPKDAFQKVIDVFGK